MKAMIPILAATAAFCFSSCTSTGGTSTSPRVSEATARKQGGSKPATAPDHEPRIDFWQNGGGACCPYHAQLHQAQTLAGSKPKKS